MKNSITYKSGLLFLACLVLIILSCTATFAQVDLQGSQYIFNKTYINPAFAGTEGTLNANLFYQMNNPMGEQLQTPVRQHARSMACFPTTNPLTGSTS